MFEMKLGVLQNEMMLRMEDVLREENRRKTAFKKTRRQAPKDKKRMAEVRAFTWDLPEEVEAKKKKRGGVKMGADDVIQEEEEQEVSTAVESEESFAEEERKVKQQVSREWGEGIVEKRSKNSA